MDVGGFGRRGDCWSHSGAFRFRLGADRAVFSNRSNDDRSGCQFKSTHKYIDFLGIVINRDYHPSTYAREAINSYPLLTIFLFHILNSCANLLAG